jgi:hypothetical protein
VTVGKLCPLIAVARLGQGVERPPPYFISGARKGRIEGEVRNAMAVKSSELKKQLGLILVAASCSIMVGVVVNGFPKIVCAAVMVLLFFLGLWLWREDCIPLFLRSGSWAKREIERVKSDPSQPLHRPYWGTSMGFFDVLRWEHESAVAKVQRLYKKAYPEPWIKRFIAT